MTYTLDHTDNASEFTISKGTMERLIGRRIDAGDWDRFCHDWDFLGDIEESAAEAFERFTVSTIRGMTAMEMQRAD